MGAPTPRLPVCDTFEKHQLSQHASKVKYLRFSAISLSPLPLTKSGLPANRQRFQIFHPTISLSNKNFLFGKNFDDVIACDLWLKPPPIKNSGYANELEIAWKKIFEDFLFGEHLRLCPWSLALASSVPVPWPREVLSSKRLSLALASSLVSSTPPLVCNYYISLFFEKS